MKLRIAMMGTKGIPAKSGGIERYVEEIGARLVALGHDVTVFGSKWYCGDYKGNIYKGMRIIKLPVFHTQATDALNNAFIATIRLLFARFDIVHFHNYAAYYFVPFVKLMGVKTVITSHGLVDDAWHNPKYNSFAKSIIQNAGRVGINHADTVTTIADYWRQRILEYSGRDSYVLPSGIEEINVRLPDTINTKYNLSENDYILFLGRIDPIKRVDWVVNLNTQNTIKIVIAGGAQDKATDAYYRKLKDRSSSQVIFTGPVYGQEKEELLSNCRLFINPSSSEGIPITILEAMSYGRCCVASDIPPHKQIIKNGDTGFLFDTASEGDLNTLINELLDMSMSQLNAIGAKARKEMEGVYDWDKTTVMIERIYQEMVHEK